jgi:AraC-like DNA-binding protein
MSEPPLTPSPDAVAALRRHPDFSRAIRSSAASSVALYQTSRPLNALLSDRARALFTHVALYLHYRGAEPDHPGLTVSAMKDLCVQLKLCSRGRCEAILALMRAGGLLAAASDPDRRKRLLAPTEKLLALHRERWGAQFEAMRAVLPEADAYRAAVTDPDFVEAFADALVRRFIAGLRVLDNAPVLELFAERNAGMMILYSLALAGEEGDTFPPTGPVLLSINALATRFSVSRKHVLTLLRDAEGQSLLLRGGAANNEVTLLPRGRDALQQLIATIFLYLAQCADEALRGRAKNASSFAAAIAGG